MKKEVFIAIILGISIGLIVTIGLRMAQQAVKPQNSSEQSDISPASSIPTPTSSPPQLFITFPETGAILDTESITIRGNAQPNSFISALSSSHFASTTTDSLGNFNLEFELEAGPNRINLTSHQLNGQTDAQNLEVVYSTADFKEASASATAPEK